jgi:hypothetical protein
MCIKCIKLRWKSSTRNVWILNYDKRICLFIRIKQRLCRGFLWLIKSREVILRFHFHVLSLAIIFIKDITYTAMHASCSDLYLDYNSIDLLLHWQKNTCEVVCTPYVIGFGMLTMFMLLYWGQYTFNYLTVMLTVLNRSNH